MDLYPQLWQNGRSLVVLKIILDLGRNLQLKELVTATRGDDEAITRCCNSLATMGLITRVSYHAGWILTAQGFTFMYTVPVERYAELRAGCLAPPQQLSTGYPQLPVKPDHSPVSDLLKTITTTHPDSKVVEVINDRRSNAKSGRISDFYAENLQTFAEIGISLNPQTEFIAQHIDPATVRAVWQKLVDRGKPWPGLLIRILTSMPRPKSKAEHEAEVRHRYAAYDQERIK
jgi:hypothetical protein